LKGFALRELGRLDESLRAFELARESADDPQGEARALLGEAGTLRILDRPTLALHALQAAEGRVDPETRPELWAELHYLRGNVLFPAGDTEACLASQAVALE